MNTRHRNFNNSRIAILVSVLLFFIGGLFLGNRLFGSKRAFPPANMTKQQVENQLTISLLDSGVTMEMVLVPAGTFAMGSENEAPIHTVYLDAFWIDRTEVTNAQFAAFVGATGYTTTAEKAGESRVDGIPGTLNADWKHPQGADSNLTGLGEYPVVQVSWYGAAAYCQWRDARLPTKQSGKKRRVV